MKTSKCLNLNVKPLFNCQTCVDCWKFWAEYFACLDSNQNLNKQVWQKKKKSRLPQSSFDTRRLDWMGSSSAIRAEWRLRRNKQIYCERANPKQSGCLFFTCTLSLPLGLLMNSLNLALRTERAKLPRSLWNWLLWELTRLPLCSTMPVHIHKPCLYFTRHLVQGLKNTGHCETTLWKLGYWFSAGCMGSFPFFYFLYRQRILSAGNPLV